MENSNWYSVKMFCPNCGVKIAGYRREDGAFKVDCPRCAVKIFSKQKTMREINIKLTSAS